MLKFTKPQAVATGFPEAGQYIGTFKGLTAVPKSDGDPMTGKGKREWDSLRFEWDITDGQFKGKTISREVTVPTGAGADFYKWADYLLGRNAQAGEEVNLEPCIGRKYMLSYGKKKPDKPYTCVTQCMRMPE